MPKYLLKVKYRLRAHETARFERILLEEVVPLAEELGLKLSGVWRSFVGNAGEYLEMWEFDSMEEFESRWKELLGHPRIQEIFKTTGAMVENENFALFESIWPE